MITTMLTRQTWRMSPAQAWPDLALTLTNGAACQ